MIKVKLQLKTKQGNKLVLVPVVGYDVIKCSKKTGKKLTEKQLAKAKRDEVETRQILKENTSFWKQFPSARFDIVADDNAKVKSFNEGDLFEVTITKIKK